MMKTLITATLALGATTLFAGTAMATTEKPAEPEAVTKTVRTIDADGRVGQITVFTVESSDRDTQVLGAFERQETDAYIVRDNDGDLYINHIVPVEELPDPNLEVEVLDTYQVEYRGMIFTNKVVDKR